MILAAGFKMCPEDPPFPPLPPSSLDLPHLQPLLQPFLAAAVCPRGQKNSSPVQPQSQFGPRPLVADAFVRLVLQGREGPGLLQFVPVCPSLPQEGWPLWLPHNWRRPRRLHRPKLCHSLSFV